LKLQTRHPLLKFENAQDKLTDSLSAAVFVGDNLWVASDETTSVERLSTDDGLTFQHHKSFPLDRLLNLPAHDTEFDQEIDIEGMDYLDSYLWLIGSHSGKRKKVGRNDQGSDAKLIGKLAKSELDGNRFLLARVPLVINGETGEQELRSPVEAPPGSGQILQASRLPGDTRSDALTDALRQAEGGHGDLHLASFLNLPGKDNGLDIEGLAVTSEKVFVGLRGPALRGWAVILELSISTSDSSRLMLNNFEANGRPYRKHFLDLNGLGIRELCVNGEDLLVLAGPTMNLDGPTTLYRWKNALNAAEESLVRGERLARELEIPFGAATDHAEGIALIPDAQTPLRLLVVYDSPSSQRKEGTTAVRADIFELPIN
jgi:Protein of unknown function (DUF3616)